jgi:hypothetical protein
MARAGMRIACTSCLVVWRALSVFIYPRPYPSLTSGQHVLTAMNVIGLTDAEQNDLVRMLASVLHVV